MKFRRLVLPMADRTKHRRRPAITPSEARSAVIAYDTHGSSRKAADALGITRSALMRRRRKADLWGITAHGEVIASQARQIAKPEIGVKRFILTAAQSNTKAHPELWKNLIALAGHYDDEILVGRIRYNHTEAQ
ncbi:MAG: hypothetical protein ABJI14_15865, partial [Marinomonas sp.]